jgi:hypothetical protein
MNALRMSLFLRDDGFPSTQRRRIEGNGWSLRRREQGEQGIWKGAMRASRAKRTKCAKKRAFIGNYMKRCYNPRNACHRESACSAALLPTSSVHGASSGCRDN